MIGREACLRLLAAARNAQHHAYAPYSHFTVGAAVLGVNDDIYTGCNVENASYGLTLCAERNALTHAVVMGCLQFQALAVAGDGADYTVPCGACRQVMAEFRIPYIIMVKHDDTYKIVTLEELFPDAFVLER